MAKKLAKCELEKKFLLAAEQTDYAVVKECLSLGVNPNARRPDRVTALHIAAERGDIELATLLVEAKGLNLNPFTVHGYTPLIIAVNSRQGMFVEFLLRHGANVDMPERFGKAALHHAAFMDCVELADILIRYNANVNLMDVFSHTPLSISVINRHYLPMVKTLIENGADVNLDRGELVLHLFLEACLACLDEQYLEIVVCLLEHGTDPNTRDERTNRNGLHYFAMNNYIPLGRVLGEWGTNVYHVDNYNLSPLKIATQHNNLEAMDFLQNLELERKGHGSKRLSIQLNQ